jgi:hypothetical protein
MKSKLQLSAAILLLSLCAAPAQVNFVPGTPAAPAFDPATGQPIPPQVPEWKDSNWKDPDITLTNVFYDNLPLSEIARSLRDQFKEQFDIILPAGTGGRAINRLNGTLVEDMDWNSTQVQLRLKNVTASEIFSAMNLIFENDQTPLHWELKVNGHRQIALLRVLVDRNPQVQAPLREEARKIYFVGDLIGDDKTPGMTMEQIVNTITDVWNMTDTTGATIKFHKDAQLIVVSGTPNQIDFMAQTLEALRHKTELARAQLKAAEMKAKSDQARTGGGGGSK